MTDLSMLAASQNVREYYGKQTSDAEDSKGQFQEILDTKIDAAEEKSSVREGFLAEGKKQKNINSNSNSTEVGTNLASKQLRDYAVSFERHIISSMWQFAYASTKGDKDSIADTLYSGQFIDQMVGQAYGENGGVLAESIYEKLKLDYAKFLEDDNDENGFDKEF